MNTPFDQLLRETLAARAAAPPDTPCLDAETAAALADAALPASERSSAEAHVAECARCQALLAALVRTAPPAPTRAWWRRPVMMWAAPLAVAAAAAVVWVNVARQDRAAPAVTQSARLDALPQAAQEERRPRAAGSADSLAPSARGADIPAPAAPVLKERDQTAAPKKVPRVIQPSAIVDSKAATAQTGQGARAAFDASAADAQLPSTQLPPAAPPVGAAAASAPATEAGQNRTAAVEAMPERSRAETAIGTRESRILARRLDTVAGTIVVSSNAMVRWHIGRNGIVERSANGGSTWQTQSTGAAAMLTAGSSPSPAVCWLVGPAGVVVLTIDEGRSWQRVQPPAAIDLASVNATDEKTATVVAADGRSFATADGGRTWNR